MSTKHSIELDIYLSKKWKSQPRSNLEIAVETTRTSGISAHLKIEDYLEYKHLIQLDISQAATEVLELITKRYLMLRNSIPDESKSILDQTLKIIIEINQEKETEARKKLKNILNKEKQAAFKHIKNAYSSLGAAVMLSQTSKTLGIKILCAGLNELYTGDQRFFKENTNTRSQIARKGGYARRDRYLETKKEACRLLIKLTPLEGWAREFDAFKAILPGVQNFMANNNTRYPAQTSIERTLRRWIKHDPMISAAIRLANPIPFNDC